MIRVNLLPGGKKGSGGPKFSFELPSIGGLPTDKWVLSAAALGIVVLAGIAYLYMTTTSRIEELDLQVEEAVRDSARFADLIEQTDRLQARRDSIAEKVAIIQEIDQDRYIWPHIMDEVARALPDFVWLSGLVQVARAGQLEFQVSGRAGNNFALTRFMENLEASPFIRNVSFISTTQVLEGRSEPGGGRLVNEFQLEAAYEQPGSELLETVPLFEEGAGASSVSSDDDGTDPSSSGDR